MNLEINDISDDFILGTAIALGAIGLLQMGVSA
jgi:hypothetical protein